ncbi:helix-turn-helix transcriptional regulator [Sulfurivirga sp.]|uniref:ArsR/SmtB family transcription factor n=1 Tax=Sulfurivirga sp. TaxID=2614236 RepID=UPI0025E1CC2C|nr:metalloregulator ArsR/SmtB family transcription factor [Sulfurivirga sp.]
MMEQASGFFKLLSEPVRLRLVALLMDGESHCVCDLVSVLGLPQSTVSRHLSLLRNGGLVLAERQGTWMHYRLNPDLSDWQRQALEAVRQLKATDDQLRRDDAALNQALCSKGGCTG